MSYSRPARPAARGEWGLEDAELRGRPVSDAIRSKPELRAGPFEVVASARIPSRATRGHVVGDPVDGSFQTAGLGPIGWGPAHGRAPTRVQ